MTSKTVNFVIQDTPCSSNSSRSSTPTPTHPRTFLLRAKVKVQTSNDLLFCLFFSMHVSSSASKIKIENSAGFLCLNIKVLSVLCDIFLIVVSVPYRSPTPQSPPPPTCTELPSQKTEFSWISGQWNFHKSQLWDTVEVTYLFSSWTRSQSQRFTAMLSKEIWIITDRPLCSASK